MVKVHVGPRGGRYIIRNKRKVYLSSGVNIVSKGHPLKGWRKRKPSSKQERQEVREKFGSKAFLYPSENKFPIVSKYSSTGKPDCGGLLAARIHGTRWKYQFPQYRNIPSKAVSIARNQKCAWVK